MNKRLKALRSKLDKTQTEMAELFGVHMRTYQAWEHNRRATSAGIRTLIDKIAREYGVNPDSLPPHTHS